MRPLSRARFVFGSFAACLAATGCVRRAGEPFAAAGSAGSSLEGPIEETRRPTASFVVDGRPFCFAGTNNYYLMYASRPMVDDVLETSRRLGLAVVRMWAYLDVGSLDGRVPHTDPNGDADGSKHGVYFQYWDPERGRPAYNDGPTGLEHLDYVLDAARRLGLKVMLVLTNNWRDFGGMDQYLAWYGLREHRQFYTDARVARAYESWVAHLASRVNTMNGTAYRDDPTIFGWELANEPRCSNAPAFGGAPTCDPAMIVRWAREMSAFVKSVDPHHLVSVGDEGFFARGAAPQYDGAEGVDHQALLAIESVDFGTFHLYPETWGRPLEWARGWIEDHIEAARAAGKPTLLEEYGVRAPRDAAGQVAGAAGARRPRVYARWHEIVDKRGGNGALFWMLAGLDDGPDAAGGRDPDYDHFELYATDPAAGVVARFAAAMKGGAQACKLFRSGAAARVSSASPFVTVSPPPPDRAALVTPARARWSPPEARGAAPR